MIQALPVKDWPASERLAGNALPAEPTVRLRRGGRAAHMRPETQRDLARRYGYFLRSSLLDEETRPCCVRWHSKSLLRP